MPAARLARRSALIALVLVGAGAFVTAARAQQSGRAVAGRIVEAGGAPLAGTDVEVIETGRRTASDSAGRWRFAAVGPEARTLRIRRIGYAPRTIRIADGAAEMVVTLEPMALRLDEIAVTGSRREQRLADVAVPTELVSRDMIASTGAADIAAVLTEQTGIQFAGGHPSGAGVMLQGLSSERVLVLLDGQPLVGRISGNLDLARIPTELVDRIEVVKGPQSALYGSEAMGGVVNIITQRPQRGTMQGSARALAGGQGRVEVGAGANIAAGDFAALVDIGRRSVDRAPGQPAETGALAERLDVSARLGWAPAGAWEADASLLVVDERQRWPSGTMNDFADNVLVSGGLGATVTLGAHRFRPAVHLSHFDHLARRSTFTSPIAGTGNRQTQRLLEAELLYSGPLAGSTIDGGIEVKQERITSSDGRIEGGARTLASVEPFVQVDWSTERFSLVPGARLTWNERWGTTVTPRLAARYRVSDALSLRAAAGRGFRAPDFKELYLQFTNDAAGYAVYGNPDLEPEHSTNLTGGFEWTGVRLYARAQAFWNDLQDFIETRPAPDGGSVVRYEYANVSRGRTWGTEIEGGLVLAPVRIEAGYAWLATRDEATGRPLLGRPEHSARVSVGGAPLARTRVTVTTIYTGATPMERDESGAIVSEREAFTRVDLRLARELPAGLEAVLGADNLFDTRPAQWADATGRLWYAGLRWTTPSFGRN